MKFIVNRAPHSNTEYRFLKLQGVGHYYVDRELEYVINGEKYTIKTRFYSDGYSIPKLLQGVFSKTMCGMMAAFFHDMNYKTDCDFGWDRKESDQLLRAVMGYYDNQDELLINGKWKRLRRMRHRAARSTRRALVYSAVRVGGRATWHKRNATYHT